MIEPRPLAEERIARSSVSGWDSWEGQEYSPAKLGLGLDQEYRGGYRASAG